ncbi:MAG: type III pantothenate kinase [Acidobacteriota bacterium]|nr:type III pantothenate kinase [Acidobacteriota bacterium]MDQ3649391.1 type III pantothenate kinase [Acidobacteriota bacterium]
MLLVIDVGNTNTSLGVYDGARLVTHWRLTTARERTVDEYGMHARNLFALAGLDFKSITAVALASVVPPLNFTLKRMAENYFELTPVFIDHTTDTGLEILYHPPSDVGADRIVDAVAAVHKYGAPCIVVDFGTATTFDAINVARQYLGGVITPGITISADALFARAARLPRVEIKRPATVIGHSTVGSMQSGLYYGYVGLVDGLLRRMIDELGGTAHVIATGGLAPLIATGSELIDTVDETLTLEGLRLIYERQASTLSDDV